MYIFTRKIVLVFLFPLILLGLSKNAFASHIAGGDITVAYVSPNTFDITLTFFRDCSGIPYPGTVTISIYDKVTNAFVKSEVLNPDPVIPLTLGDGCYTPSLCLEKRLYKKASVNIPDNPNGYYITYEECCRNAGVINISGSASAGYVFYTELADPALGNSTPSFPSQPDGYMCQGYVNTDMFAATDADGDVLVYSLTDPLAASTAGAAPFTPVTWMPGYYTTNPLADPGMIVNSATGTINTLPPTLGIFVMSMKVEEYRAGVKIGQVNRDFQFQVLGCQLLNLSINPGNPICLGTSATIVPSGAGAGFSYSWSSGQTTSAIVVSPTTTGSYNYTLTATNGACVKVAATTLVANPNPTASVTVSGNICAGQNHTLVGSGGMSYLWSNGFPFQSISVSPGTYSVTVTNSYNCTAMASGTILAPVASSYTWTGTGATGANNWFDSNNWGNPDGCFPNCLADVYIPNTTNDPDIGTANGPASCKDMLLDPGASITFSSTTSELDVCGDFNDHGVILNNGGQNGILKFMGSIPQSFLRSSTASGNPFYQVIIANTGLPIPTLTLKDGVGYKDMPISNTGSFTFQSGILVTEGDRKLFVINNSSNAVSGHGPSSYVVGRIKRNLAASTSYDFPVGNMPVYGNVYPYQLMNVNFSSLSGLSDITVSFENPLLSNANGFGLPVAETTVPGNYVYLLDNGGINTGVGYSGGIGGLWTIVPDNYSSAATYSMTLQARNYDNQGSYEHSILKRNTFCPGTWSVDGSYNTSSVAGNVVTVSRTGMSGFSQVVVAATTSPLPVELVLFDAACDKEHTVLSWVTATEMNNDHFTIERSCDENFFSYQVIGTVPGAGNSNTMRTYTFTDNDDTPGNCYYRLSQTDFNGTITEFSPIQINCSENASFNFIGVLPNPAKDEINVLFTSVSTDRVTMHVTDALGKELISKGITPEIGLNKVQLSVMDFANGVYFMNISNGVKSFTRKIVKND